MSTSILMQQILAGLAYGMLLFMIASGMTIIYGLMHVMNMAHGTFFALGAYVAFSFIHMHTGFWIALLLAIIVTMIFGYLVERFLLTKMYGKMNDQVLLTFGVTYIVADLIKWFWGSDILTIPVPAILNFSIPLGDVSFPVYRLFVILIGLVLAFAMWYMENRTQTGAIIRAGVDDRDMLGALGINVKVVFSGVFMFGAGLAALGGGLAGPILSLYPGMEMEILTLSLVIVVIGGLGTWKGTFVSALLVGMIETLGQVWFPSLSMAIVFMFMVVILIFKPSGLFGKGVTA
jgi:branched-chain amino acid transport system permease protein